MYIKRTLVLGFLIVISPLITITYSIDKMGDGKSQALNIWLKEFVFTVIIQPFHCIIYLVFYSSIMGAIKGFQGADLGNAIFAAASAFFMLKAEDIVKKIFGIQPNSIGNALGTGAMALTMATSLLKGKGKKLKDGKGSMPTMTNNNSMNYGGNRNNIGNGNANRDANLGANANAVATAAASGSGSGTGNGTGSGNTQQSNAGNAQPANNSAAPAQPADVDNADDSENGRRGNPIRNLINSAWNAQRRHVEREGGWSKYMGRKISGAATIAGFIAGGAVGDFKSASSVATAAGSIASNKYDSHEYRRAERQLERNQRVFAGAYEDFARAYRDEHGNVSDEAVRIAAKDLWDSNGQSMSTEYAGDFYSQMEKLSDSAEIMGYNNGFDYVNNSMRLTDEGVIEHTDDYEPKYYNTSSSNDGSSSSNEVEDYLENDVYEERDANYYRNRFNPDNRSGMDTLDANEYANVNVDWNEEYTKLGQERQRRRANIDMNDYLDNNTNNNSNNNSDNNS